MNEVESLLTNQRAWFKKVTGRNMTPEDEALWLDMCWDTEPKNTVVFKDGSMFVHD